MTGDLDVAHREVDLENWRGNVAEAGFLRPARIHGGPDSSWSWRGKAFDSDAGWRIDHEIASPDLAARVRIAEIDRAPSCVERQSDHAPVVVDYDLEFAFGPSPAARRPLPTVRDITR